MLIPAALIALCMISLYVAVRVALSIADDRALIAARRQRACRDRSPLAPVPMARNRIGDN